MKIPPELGRPYLFVLSKPEDESKLDAAIGKMSLEIRKLGDRTYLGFFQHLYQQNYVLLRKEAGIDGKVHWMELGQASLSGTEPQ